MRVRVIAPLVTLLPVIVFLLNYGLFQQPLNDVLERDNRNQVMTARAHWRWYVDPTVLVYDLQGASGDATGVDVVRAFLQFAYRQKDRHFDRVELAWRGASRFYVQGGDFSELGRRYPSRSPVDTIPILPGMLYRPNGSKAFSTRPGTFVEQNQQRLLDFTSFINTWVSR